MSEEIIIHFDCDIAVKAVRLVLARRGLSVVRSFDLRLAMAVHHHCPCPHHGLAGCDCQYIVLLVYGDTGQPVTVTAHSYNGATQIALVQDVLAIPEPQLAHQVNNALLEAAQMLQLEPITV